MNASAILASLARRLPRRGNGSLRTEAVPPFYLYDEPRLQFGWLLEGVFNVGRLLSSKRIAHTHTI